MNRNRALLQCIPDIGVDDDRPRNQLRKHAQISTKADIGLVSFCPSEIYINDIGCDLESVEADSERQCDIESVEPPVDIEQSQGSVDIFYKEIRVLKKK